MTQDEKNLKRLFTAIGATMLVFVALIQILYGVPASMDMILGELFPNSIALRCISELILSVGYFLSFLLPTLILNKLFARSQARPIPFSLKLPDAHTGRKTLAYIFAGISMVFATAILNANLVPQIVSVAGEDMRYPYQFLLAVFSSAVIPAFSEELLFRGAILSNLKPYGKNVAILVSALMFGFMHQNAGQLLYATAAGLVMGYICVECDSIWPTVLLHFLNNMVSVLETYFFAVFRESTASLICMILEMTIFFFGIVFGALYVAAIRKDSERPAAIGVFGNSQAMGERLSVIDGRKAVKLFFCPTIILFLLLAVGNMILIYVVY